MRRVENGGSENWSNYSSVSHLFDAVDVTLQFDDARVEGFAVSRPDSRFLHVALDNGTCTVVDLTTYDQVGVFRTADELALSLSQASISRDYAAFIDQSESLHFSVCV